MEYKMLTKVRYELVDTHDFNNKVNDVLKQISGNDIDKFSGVINGTLREAIGSRIIAEDFDKIYPNIDYESFPFISINAELNGVNRTFTLGKMVEQNKIKLLNGVLTM